MWTSISPRGGGRVWWFKFYVWFLALSIRISLPSILVRHYSEIFQNDDRQTYVQHQHALHTRHHHLTYNVLNYCVRLSPCVSWMCVCVLVQAHARTVWDRRDKLRLTCIILTYLKLKYNSIRRLSRVDRPSHVVVVMSYN